MNRRITKNEIVRPGIAERIEMDLRKVYLRNGRQFKDIKELKRGGIYFIFNSGI